MEYLREITADVFDVAARLREIDARYRLFYNLKAGRYEVYTLQPRPVLQVVLAQSPPDRRSVEHVRKTRAERAAQLFEQYKKENAQRGACAQDARGAGGTTFRAIQKGERAPAKGKAERMRRKGAFGGCGRSFGEEK